MADEEKHAQKPASPGSTENATGSGKGRMLSDVLRERLRLRRYARRTEEVYVGWVRDFIRFHHGRHPRQMGAEEVNGYLGYLASERNVAAATQRQALHPVR